MQSSTQRVLIIKKMLLFYVFFKKQIFT
jgi:hypothetical protein